MSGIWLTALTALLGPSAAFLIMAGNPSNPRSYRYRTACT